MKSRSVVISSVDVDTEMTTNSGIYTISQRELEGHDNLGHSISQLTIAEEKPNLLVDPSNDKMPLKPQPRLGFKFGLSVDILITIVVVIWITVTEFGYVPHFKQGFYCGTDTKIVYKYTGDTIPMSLVLLTIGLPIIIMYFVEVFRYDVEMTKAVKSKKTVHQVLTWSREFLVGAAANLFILETLKVVVGELRPHFLESCQPDAAVNCTTGTFITDYTCMNKKDSFYFVSDSSRSFPSGHAAIGSYVGLFLTWFFQVRFPGSRTNLLRPLLQLLCLTWALVCGATRVVDNRHHWWDVLAGDLIGTSLAVIVCAVLCKNFRTMPLAPDHTNQNGHTSVRRLLSDGSCKEESHIAMDQA